MAVEKVAGQGVFGETVAAEVSYDEYMARYAADFYEWAGGAVIKMSPVTARHDGLTYYLRTVLASYFALRAIGTVRGEPFVMRLPATDSAREPDLQVILHTNPGDLTDTAMIGPADLCIEVVSSESVERDYGEKFAEYEKAGVREYWIIDPLRQEAHFYRLDEVGLYRRQTEDADGNYHTPQLPGLALHIPTLWQPTLPDPIAVGQAVRAMLGEK